MVKRLGFLIASFIFLYIKPLNATHLFGGILDYQYIETKDGHQWYDVSVWIFRDCRKDGTSEQVPFDEEILLCVYGADQKLYTSHFLKRKIIEAVEPENPDHCTAKPYLWIQKAKYSKRIALKDSSSGYTLLWERCCRGYYQNIMNDQTSTPYQGMSVLGKIPSFEIKNSTPVFENTPFLLLCIGDTLSWQINTSEADGDSLSYLLVSPYQGASPSNPLPKICYENLYALNNIEYITGFKSWQIFGSPGLSNADPMDGKLLLSSQKTGYFLGCIEITEWRNQKPISKSRFEFTSIVEFYSGNKPLSVSQLRFAPNPAKQVVLISGLPPGTNSWQLVNAMGVEVLNGNSTGEFKIDVSGLSDGVYFFRTLANGATFSQKMIVAK